MLGKQTYFYLRSWNNICGNNFIPWRSWWNLPQKCYCSPFFLWTINKKLLLFWTMGKKKKWAQISKTTVSTLNCAKSEAILRIWGKRTVMKATEILVSGIGFSPFWNSSLACFSPPYLKTVLYLPVIDSSFRQKAVQTWTKSMLLKTKFFHATHLILNLGKVTRQIRTVVLLSKH